jgi:hypothetical protein
MVFYITIGAVFNTIKTTFVSTDRAWLVTSSRAIQLQLKRDAHIFILV